MKVLLVMLLLATTFNLSMESVLRPKCEKRRYDNYTVFKIPLQNKLVRSSLMSLAENNQNFDVWQMDHKEMHLMVSPKENLSFRNLSMSLGVLPQVMISNVQSLIDQEISAVNDSVDEMFGWSRYYPLDDIENWLNELIVEHSNVVEEFEVGKSFEGRTIRGLKISYKSGNPGIFIESNIHAREWITSATSTWFINELLTNKDPAVRELAEGIDWYIVPVFNVDGFVYTHTTDRMWRKTRQPVDISDCIGTDPNRNFDSYWLQNDGASSNPCASNYAGPKPYSEPEVKALASYITRHKDKINILIAFHSYSQLLLSPYGHTVEEDPPNFNHLMTIAKSYADAVEALSYGTKYDYGASAVKLYAATGTTVDWAYNEAEIPVTYTIEFRDQGRFGFVLPPVQILPNCEETLTGILALVREARTLGYLEPKY